jgi:hypothetical protein
MAADLLARVCAEIDARLAELRPALAEHQRLLEAADALDAEAKVRPTEVPPVEARPAAKASATKARPAAKTRPAKTRPAAKASTAKAQPTSAAAQAIVAALEHGSHTVGELGIVTAMSGPDIREGLRRLQRAGTITRTRREGRAAYALSSTATG